jgi:hypothetical protein
MNTKKQNKQGLTDRYFGRKFEIVYSIDGKDSIRIDTTSIADIPAMFEEWRKEIEFKKKEIIEYENRNFFERFLDWVGGDDEFNVATGEELFEIAPSKKAADIMDKMEDDPSNMAYRLEMVSFIMRNRPEISLDEARKLFLHSILACCFGEISNKGLLIALKSQQLYFRKLKEACYFDLKRLQKILGSDKKDDIFDKNKKFIKEHFNKIKANIKLFEYYLNLTGMGINTLYISSIVTVSNHEVKKLLRSDNKQNSDKRYLYLKRITAIVTAIRFLPLLYNEGLQFANLLTRLVNEHPLPNLVKARIHRTGLLILMKQFELDPALYELKDKIKDRFISAFEAYQSMMKSYGISQDTQTYTVAGPEFARFILDSHLFFKNKLNSKLPNKTTKSYLRLALNIMKRFKRKERDILIIDQIKRELESEKEAA